jgi:4-amino-4-deoxy-L-arabinose transferase-like glycosyltransferase
MRGSAATPAWATWKCALALIVCATLARLAYNAWLSPWDLAGDEAYYWQQARHLDWCYNEKGPLLAWMIAAACRAFGDVEWAVRLPVVLAWGASAWGIGRLAIAISDGDERVGAIAGALFLLLPAFQANAQICTQDGPLVTLWIAMTAVGLGLLRRLRDGRGTWAWWLLLYALLGVGMLLKQSVLTFLPGLAVFGWLNRRALPLRWKLFLQQLAGLAILSAASAPMVWWNARHGWPMLAHTLGHLGAGGDQAGQVHKGNPLTWEGGALAGFLAFFGPSLCVMVWATFRAWNGRAQAQHTFDQRWLVCAAWFSTLFYAALALTKPIVATWPLPSMAPLVVIAAQMLAPVLCGGVPGKHLRRLWWASVAYGLAGGLAIAFPTLLTHVPAAERATRKKMLGRFGGARDEAARLAAVIADAPTPDGRPPLIVAANYGLACLTTFYLPDHPPVATRDKLLTGRHSTLEQWPETNLEDPGQRGRTLILALDHRNDPSWADVLVVDSVVPSADGHYLVALNFQGLRGRQAGALAANPGAAK